MLNKYFTLENGVKIPALGIGTWQIDNEKIVQVVKDALEVGYRHIDTAQLYENEEGIGKALKESSISRNELFITTKISASIKDYQNTKNSIEQSLQKLGLDYIDLLLIHSPRPFEEMFEYQGKDYREENLEVWKALEEAYESGKARAIGVSNFDENDIDYLIQNAKYRPMINQVLCNITHYPKRVIEKCRKRGILVQSYSPNATGKLKGKELQELADKYHCTLPQLGNRFDFQLGTVVLPKTTHKEYMIQDSQIHFEISKEDMEYLQSLGQYVGWKGADSE